MDIKLLESDFKLMRQNTFSSIPLLMYGMVYHPMLSIVPQLRYSKKRLDVYLAANPRLELFAPV